MTDRIRTETTTLCGQPHYRYSESLCTEPAGHYQRGRDPHAGPLIIDGVQRGGLAWDEPKEQTVTTTDDFDGCTRACRKNGAHTLVWGECERAPESARPEPTISIGRVEPFEDGYPGIVLRSIPLPAWESLITVAKWVSRGKSFAFDADPDIAPAYPDAAARRALGALDDAGLLDRPKEPTP